MSRGSEVLCHCILDNVLHEHYCIVYIFVEHKACIYTEESESA